MRPQAHGLTHIQLCTSWSGWLSQYFFWRDAFYNCLAVIKEDLDKFLGLPIGGSDACRWGVLYRRAGPANWGIQCVWFAIEWWRFFMCDHDVEEISEVKFVVVSLNLQYPLTSTFQNVEENLWLGWWKVICPLERIPKLVMVGVSVGGGCVRTSCPCWWILREEEIVPKCWFLLWRHLQVHIILYLGWLC